MNPVSRACDIMLTSLDFPQPGICETTPGVKSYSGYVHLPPHFLEDGNGEIQDYPINTLVTTPRWWWCFSIYLNMLTVRKPGSFGSLGLEKIRLPLHSPLGSMAVPVHRR